MGIRRARVRAGSERGATAVEYGIIVALISIVIVVSLTFLGQQLNGSLDDSANAVDDAVTGTVEGGQVVQQVDLGGGAKGCPPGSAPSQMSKGKCVKK